MLYVHETTIEVHDWFIEGATRVFGCNPDHFTDEWKPVSDPNEQNAPRWVKRARGPSRWTELSNGVFV